MLGGLLLLSGPARGNELLAACQGPAWQQLLQAEARPAPAARAVWLGQSELLWPGQPVLEEGEQLRLLHAAAPTIVASPGQPARGHDGAATLQVVAELLPAALASRFGHLGPALRLALAGPDTGADAEPGRLRGLHRGQLLLVREHSSGAVREATRVQHAAALDELYPAAWDERLGALPALGLTLSPRGAAPAQRQTRFALWAPTARQVAVCLHADDRTDAHAVWPLQRDEVSGVWHGGPPADLRGGSYRYLVDVLVPGQGLVRQRVADPYAISLGLNSQRAWIGALDDPATLPAGWADAPRPAALRSMTEMSVYELQVRDFSVGDASVPPAQRGKYLAFTQSNSDGMRHLRALAQAGLSDVHLLPVFDIASVPELACSTPGVPAAAPNSLVQQAAVMAGAAGDCFNWGYDPLHFNAPEGSYASSAADGATRLRELRQMVMALHAAGLRVGMDVVYNHLSAAGQTPQSVLDRIVPGYYHRLLADGEVANSTCCANSATEHRMMARLMGDSVRLWARQHRIDSFRFDLMGHQPLAEMLRIKAQLRADNGRDIPLIGEGWNFGEVADGSRFVQAAQRQLAGSGIASFSDRGRDALRGGGVGDSPADMVARQGYLNGLAYDPNDAARQRDPAGQRQALLASADLVRLALAGTLRSYRFTTADGRLQRGDGLDYGGQPAGYAAQPGEVVNYVENHDNHTLWDLNAFKLPLATPAAERARVQVLGLAFTALSQGIPYFHGGVDLLRSKSMDGNSYDSGDWFNRLDFSARDNYFGSGLPPLRDNAALHALAAPRLVDPALRPAAHDILFARDALRDLLRLRASSRLFRLDSAQDVQQRLQMHNTGPKQNPVLIAAELDGRGLAGAGFSRVMLLFNVDRRAHSLHIGSSRGQPWQLHPVHLAPQAADRRPREAASFDVELGRFDLPPRTAMVYVLP